MEWKTTPNSAYLLSENPKGVFIATREEGGQLETAGQKHGRSHAHMAVRAALRVARCLVCPLSDSMPGFGFPAPGFDETASLGQWIFM